jgi:hypothetical protein
MSTVETIFKFAEELSVLLFFGLRNRPTFFRDALGELRERQVLFLLIIFLGTELQVVYELSSSEVLLQQLNKKLDAIRIS